MLATEGYDQFVDGVVRTIRELIPGAELGIRIFESSAIFEKQGFRKKGVEGFSGGQYRNQGFTLWFDLTGGRVCSIDVSRKLIPLTSTELRVLGRIPDCLAGLLVSASSRGLELSQRISGLLSLGHLLLSKFLRGGHAATYWTPADVLFQLQELTFRRYEGSPCTSGFVFTSQLPLYTARVSHVSYHYSGFAEPITMRASIFAKPASFRYVDGKNSFYLIDNRRRIYGTLSAKDPRKFNRVDRCYHQHIAPLVEQMPGRVWVAYAGDRADVNVHMTGGVHFRWERNNWHLRDKSILSSILQGHGFSPELVPTLSAVVYALSDLRLGALILIPDTDANVPGVVGVIDDSDLGKSLRESLTNRTVGELIASDSLLGVLSSDGLTTISKSGKIIGCGGIINVVQATEKMMAGGGRTHAAMAASEYGLAIKISEDGPISLFAKGGELIRL